MTTATQTKIEALREARAIAVEIAEQDGSSKLLGLAARDSDLLLLDEFRLMSTSVSRALTCARKRVDAAGCGCAKINEFYRDLSHLEVRSTQIRRAIELWESCEQQLGSADPRVNLSRARSAA